MTMDCRVLFPSLANPGAGAGPVASPGPGGAPRASVVIVNYNGRRHLQACLGSLLSDRPNYEIILVDNGSTDGSVEYVERAFPEVGVIRNATNGGFGHGSNLGLRHARGEYVAFLNPDTAVEPGWLDSLVAALDENPDAALATSKIVLVNNAGRINTCGNEVHCSGLTLCRGMGLERGAFDEPDEVGAVSGAAFAARRSILEQLGGFDPSFFLYMEDTDLSWRVRLAGQRCLYVPQSVVHHDYRLRFGPRKTFYQERNRYVMLLKSLRWRSLLVLLPILLLGEAVTWGFVLLRDRRRWLNKIEAYIWVVQHWREIMERRRRVQACRRVPDRLLLARCSHCLHYEQADGGPVGWLAHLFFDPLFFVFQRLALQLIRW